jgi:hypothetical protein
MKNIYVVVSKTGSIVSRLIGRATGDPYTHASIALDDSLEPMYSFGRIYTNNPVIGGFVKESVNYGSMKKFRTAEIVVIQLKVENEQYAEINEYIDAMYRQRKKYHYNYIGFFLAKFGLHIHRDNYFYCSEFVKDLLTRFHIIEEKQFSKVVRPVELLNVEGTVVYQGKLCEYAAT